MAISPTLVHVCSMPHTAKLRLLANPAVQHTALHHPRSLHVWHLPRPPFYLHTRPWCVYLPYLLQHLDQCCVTLSVWQVIVRHHHHPAISELERPLLEVCVHVWGKTLQYSRQYNMCTEA